MRQVCIIAAAGIVALDSMVDRLQEDHKRANAIGKGEQYVTATKKGCSADATGCLANHAIPYILWRHVVHFRVKDSYQWLSSSAWWTATTDSYSIIKRNVSISHKFWGCHSRTAQDLTLLRLTLHCGVSSSRCFKGAQHLHVQGQAVQELGSLTLNMQVLHLFRTLWTTHSNNVRLQKSGAFGHELRRILAALHFVEY